jgi:starch-binding outer membrane protein SusE/F
MTYTVEQFNTIALALGLTTDTASQIEARMKSVVTSLDGSAGNLPTVYSPAVTITVTPYALISYLYAPGAYQGWDPTTANTLVSATSNGIYIGFINFPAAGSEFKITVDHTWNTNYGSSNGVDLVVNGSNITSPGAGYYKLTVDTNTMKYTLVPYQISMIGSATPGGDWSTDVNMAWDNTLLKWKVSSTFLAGEFKFRLNHDWGTNWGTSGGGNIPITAGAHVVLFDPYDFSYSIQ